MLKKTGFSMAELLLVIMIIGIVSAMGITITKHGTDKSYNLFFYNGYINLYNSMADILSEGNATTITAIDLNDRLGTGALPATEIITANNGITYQCDDAADCRVITMTVPQRKTKANPHAVATINLQYENDPNNLLLIPISGTVDLQNRRDLLPVYIDDGFVGRVKSDGTFAKIQYRSYNEAYCELGKPNITNVITCNSTGSSKGSIKFADPRKAH